jgi:uncharacterized repeat protein (TIGR04076 family)
MKFNSEEIMDRRSFVKSGIVLATGLTLSEAGASPSCVEEIQLSQERRKTMIHKCKITVLRRELYQDLADQYLADPKSGKCPYFTEGQEFLVDGTSFFRMLNGKFCSEAWDCISRYVLNP